MNTPTTSEKTPTAVLDTSLLLAAIAQGRHDPENNSPLDRDLREQGIEPEKVRGHILETLATHHTLVPNVVFRELQGHKQNPKLSQTNLQNLQALLYTLEGYTTPTVASRTDLFMQKNGLETLENQASLQIQALADQNPHFEPYVPDWESLNPHSKTPPENPTLAAFKHEIKKLPTCLTWLKIKHHLPGAQKNTTKLLENPHITKTEQLHLLEEAQLLQRELELWGEEEPPEPHSLSPTVQKILEDFQKGLPENSKRKYEELNPKNFAKAPRHLQASRLKFLANQLAPYLIADVEIALTAYPTKAKILTLDKDFAVLQNHLGKLKNLPPPENKTLAPGQELKILLQKLRGHLRKSKPTPEIPQP
jgi:hypothetical protein